MSDINQVTIIGRLIRDPEVRFAPARTPFAAFSLASNHAYQDRNGRWKDEVAFVPCVAFGDKAPRPWRRNTKASPCWLPVV